MSQVRLTGSGGGNTILNGNDTITADQTFEFPNTGGTLLTGSQTETGDGGSSGSAQVVGYQQGLWTPYFSLLNGDGAISNYDSQSGRFTRVGNQITAYFFCVTRSLANGSWDWQNGASTASATLIGGLPYNHAASNPVGSGFLSWGTQLGRVSNNTPSITDVTIWIGANDSKMRLSKRVDGGNDTWGFQDVIMSDFIVNSGSGLQGVVTYMTSDTAWAPINGATVS